MTTLQDIRQAIADTLKAALGVQISPWMLSNPTPPAGHVFPSNVDPHKTFGPGGLEEWTFTLQMFVGEAGGDVGAQIKLDEYLRGSSSVREVLEADPTLGGVVEDLTVTNISGYRNFVTQGRANVLGAEWTITVLIDEEE